jgi:hypothetical protein
MLKSSRELVNFPKSNRSGGSKEVCVLDDRCFAAVFSMSGDVETGFKV